MQSTDYEVPESTRPARRRTVRTPLSALFILWALGVQLFFGLPLLLGLLTQGDGEGEGGVGYSLVLFLAMVLMTGPWALWCRGITLEANGRWMRLWSGPHVPLFRKRLHVRAFHTVSVGLERRRSGEHKGLAREPVLVTRFRVRLQQDLDPASWDPHGPQPRAFTVATFGLHADALAFAQEVVALTGLALRDDHDGGPP